MSPSILPRPSSEQNSKAALSAANAFLAAPRKSVRRVRSKTVTKSSSAVKPSFRWKRTLAENLTGLVRAPGSYGLQKSSGKIGANGRAKTSGVERDDIIQGIFNYISARVTGCRSLDVTSKTSLWIRKIHEEQKMHSFGKLGKEWKNGTCSASACKVWAAVDWLIALDNLNCLLIDRSIDCLIVYRLIGWLVG